MKTLFEYLSEQFGEGKTEFRLVVNARARNPSGPLITYIHPLGKDGESADFAISSGDLIRYETIESA